MKKKVILPIEEIKGVWTPKGIDILHDCEMIYDIPHGSCTVFMNVTEIELASLTGLTQIIEDAPDWEFSIK